MDKDTLIRTLVEFFIDEFTTCPADVSDWFAQGDQNVDAFVEALKRHFPSIINDD